MQRRIPLPVYVRHLNIIQVGKQCLINDKHSQKGVLVARIKQIDGYQVSTITYIPQVILQVSIGSFDSMDRETVPECWHKMGAVG